MRWSSLLTWALFLFFFVGVFGAPVADSGQRDIDTVPTLEPRQQSDTTSTTTDTRSNAASTTTSNVSTETTADSTVSNTHSAPSPSTTIPSLDGSSASSDKDPKNDTKPKYSGGLPIQPEITPAWGVGGIILLLLGATLAFIGVRKKWAHIFLSTAFLAALGVTVLIVYVMNPPVSNAVQGGYLIAVFFTGAIFGGLALVFKEITEGLGCLLGGFCLGMWFLTLRSGGLVSSSGPKVGLIVAFAVGFYCLSFSHYTRSYGLIACTAFSGATALVLGIDCYSKAGLKEFWLYIWDLNEDVFPSDTYTYPVTRNIRVEIAVIIIVAASGVISQLRLWKVIKERRAKEENSRKEDEKKNDEAEAEVGRQLKEKNVKERAEWENVYGHGHSGKTPSLSETAVAEDSRRGSDGYGSSDIEKRGEFEIKEMTSPDDSVGASAYETSQDSGNQDVPDTPVAEQDEQYCDVQPSDDGSQHLEAEMPRATTPVPSNTAGPTHLQDDRSEHGAVFGSEAGALRSRCFSDNSLKRMSWQNREGANVTDSQHEDTLAVPEDTNSSVAGVVDELHDVSTGCASITPSVHNQTKDNDREESVDNEESQEGKSAPEETKQAEIPAQPDPEAIPQTAQETRNEASSQAAENDQSLSQRNSHHRKPDNDTAPEKENEISAGLNQPAESAPKKSEDLDVEEPRSKDAVPDAVDTAAKNKSLTKDNTPKQLPSAVDAKSGAEKTQEQQRPSKETEKETERKEKMRLDTSTVQSIPEQTSRIIHSYRTNEWAKNLADAETPDAEPIYLESELQDDSEDLTEAQEAATPVDMDLLLQTPFNAQPPPAVNRPEFMDQSTTSPKITRRHSGIPSPAPSADVPRSRPRRSAQSTNKVQPPQALCRTSSASKKVPHVAPGLSLPEQDDAAASTRRRSAPFLTITAPQESSENTNSPRWSGPPPLLAVRENMVRNRMSSTSLRYDPWTSRNQSWHSLAEPSPLTSPTLLSIPQERDEEQEETSQSQVDDDEDDIPLSKRRVMLQRQTIHSPSSTTIQSVEPIRSPSSADADSGRSAAVMAAWRHSVREDISQRRDPLALSPPTPLGSPSSERPRSLWGSVQQMRDASSAQLGNAIADGMQRGSMTDLHRQAMRRMQASVNRKM